MKIILFMEKLKGLLKKVVCFSVVMTFLLRLGYSEGTRELLVRPTPLGFFDSTKIGPGVQIWDTPWQSNRRTGTYASIASGGMGVASDAIYRIKIRICNVGEVINMGFDQPDNDVFFRLYKPDGTTVQFDDAMVINPGDATTATLFGGEQGALGHPYTYRVPRSTDNAGYIRFFRQAYVGPQPATGQVNGVGPVSNGYIPIQHIADQVGEYYIVFNPTHPDNLTMAKRVFRKFDITVWNNMASKTVRRGRLYSAAWDFNCNSDIETFNSELFFYSKDSVVTAVRFNQMQPFGFIITANSTGCTATGNQDFDRRSRILFNGYPEYPVFFNDPVAGNNCAITPKASFGKVDTVTITGCHDDRCINIKADKTAKVGISLLPVSPGPLFVPRIFDDQMVYANKMTCIPWDGKDGAGNRIIGPVEVVVNYYNGLTHLPLYDVENHIYGYTIRLVAPLPSPGADPILVYWDDRPPATDPVTDFTAGYSRDGLVGAYPPGTAVSAPFGSEDAHSSYNLTGCNPDPSIDHDPVTPGIQGCHLWSGRGLNVTCPGNPNCAETINTWWNANVIKKRAVYYPSNIEVYAMRSHAPVPIGFPPHANTPNDTIVCANVGSVTMNGLIRREVPAGSGIYVPHTGSWSIVSGAGTLTNPNSSNATYNIHPADVGNTVVLRLTSDSTSATPCGRAYDEIRIHVKPASTVNAGPNQQVCKTNPTVTLNGSVGSGVLTYQWTPSVTGGIFVPSPQHLAPTYTPPASITSAPGTSVVTMTLSSLTTRKYTEPDGEIASCPPASSSMTITYISPPVVSAGGPYSVCNNGAGTVVNLSGLIDGSGVIPSGYTVQWSGAGSFSATSGTLTPTYTPTASERSSGTATVTLTVTKVSAPSCAAQSSTATITIVSPPVVSAGLPFSVCKNNATIDLNGSIVSGMPDNVVWSVSGGTGSFGGTQNNLNARYIPSPGDLGSLTTAGSLTFTLTAVKAGCPNTSSSVVVNLIGAPLAQAGPVPVICGNEGVARLNGTAINGTSVQWESLIGAPGTFSPSANVSNPVYTLSSNQLSLGVVRFVFHVTGQAGCAVARDTMSIVVVTQPAIVNAGPDLSVCINNPEVNITGASSTGGDPVRWRSLSSSPGSFSNNTLLSTKYTLSASELSAGQVFLVLSDSTNVCPIPTRDTLRITVTPAPVVNAGNDQSVCVNKATVSLSGSSSTGSGVWSVVSGGGSFGNETSLNTTFTPASPDLEVPMTLRLTSTNNGVCNPVMDDVVINFTPAPTVSAMAVSSNRSCRNNPNVNIQGTSSTGSGEWIGGAGTFIPSRMSASAVYQPTAGELTTGVSLTFRSMMNGSCNAVSSEPLQIEYIPSPTANAGPDRTVCANNPVVTISGASVTGATGATWVSSSGCVSCFNGTENNINPVYTPNASDINAGSVRLTMTTTGNVGNCLSVQDEMEISIRQGPSVDAGADRVICSSENTVSLSGSSTNSSGLQWGISTGSGTISNATSGNATYNISAMDKTNGLVILTLSTTGNSPCAEVSDQLIITLTDQPRVNAGPDKTVCTGDMPIELDASGSPGVWTASVGGVFTPGNTVHNARFQPSMVSAGNITFTYTSNAGGACPSVSDQVVITVINSPVAVYTGPVAVCGDQGTISLSGTSSTGSGIWVSGGTGSFDNETSLTPVYTPSGLDRSRERVDMMLITTNNGVCEADTAQVTIDIDPAVIVNAGGGQTVCSTSGSVTLSGSVLLNPDALPLGPYPTMTWSVVTGGAVISSPNSLSTSASGLMPSGGVITFRLTSAAHGSCPPQSSDVTYTFVAPPVVNITTASPQDICSDGVGVTVSGTITGAGSGEWISSGTGTFSPNNSWHSGQTSVQYIPSAADIASGMVQITLRSSAGSGVCGAVSSAPLIVNIHKRPEVNAGPDQVKCKNNAVVNLSGSLVHATAGTWTSSSECMGCFGGTQNMLNATYTPSATDLENGFVTLTLSSTNGSSSCGAGSDQMIVRFTEAPVVDAGRDRSACANNRNINLLGEVTPLMSNFVPQWSSSGDGVFSVTNNVASIYTIGDGDTTAGTVRLTLTVSDATGLCAPVSDDLVVTISDAPRVEVGPDKVLCSDSFYVRLQAQVYPNLSPNPSGIWSSSGSGSFFNMNASSDTAVYVFSPSDKSLGEVVLKYTTPSGACLPVSDSLKIRFTPSPEVVITSGSGATICANQNTINLSGTFTVAGGAEWITSGTGTFMPQSSGVSPFNTVYTISALDRAAGNVVLTLRTTDGGPNGCRRVSRQFNLVIQPLNVADAGPDVTVCQDAFSISLAGASTNTGSGYWQTSGTGVFGPNNQTIEGTYYPSQCCFTSIDSTQSSVTLQLTTLNNGVCPAASDSKVITFIKRPRVNAGPDQLVCENTASVALTGSALHSSSQQWSRVGGGGSFTPHANMLNPSYTPDAADIAAGHVNLVLRAYGNGSCGQVTDTVRINFKKVPSVNVGPDANICALSAEDPTLMYQIGGLTLLHSSSVLWSSSGTGTFNLTDPLRPIYDPSPADIANGQVTIIATTNDAAPCTNVSDAMVINIQKLPTVNIGPDIESCVGQDLPIQLNAVLTNASGGSWSTSSVGTFDDPNILTPIYNPGAADDAVGTDTIVFSTPPGVCPSVKDVLVIYYNVTPPFSAGSDITVCFRNAMAMPQPHVQLNATGVGTWSVLMGDPGGTFFPNANSPNAIYIPSTAALFNGNMVTLRYTASNPCSALSHDDVTVTFLQGPVVNAGADYDVCSNQNTVNLTNTTSSFGTGNVTWTILSGFGSLSATNILQPTYSIAPNDLVSGRVVLRVATTGNAPCAEDADTVIINIQKIPTVNAGADQIVCADLLNVPNAISVSASFTVASGITWSSPHGSFNNSSSASTTFTATSFPATITATAAAIGPCPAVTDDVVISSVPIPVVDLSDNPLLVCSEQRPIDLQLLGAIVSAPASGVWSKVVGSGVFTPNEHTINARYTPSAADLGMGSVRLRLTATNTGVCTNSYYDEVLINFRVQPRVDGGSDITFCAQNNTVSLSGSASEAVPPLGVRWEVENMTGVFVSGMTSLNAVYDPSVADVAQGGGIIRFITTNAAPCPNDTDYVSLVLVPEPAAIVDAGFNQSLCRDVTRAQLQGIIINADGGVWSIVPGFGSGSFDDVNKLDAVYTFSASDKTLPRVRLVLTSVGGNQLCQPVSDTMDIVFTPTPQVTASAPVRVCADTAYIQLTGSIMQASINSGTWSTSGDGYFSTSAHIMNPVYVLGPRDISNGRVGFTLVSNNNGTCQAYRDTANVIITPAIVVNAGSDKVICANNSNGVSLLGSSSTGSGVWQIVSGDGSLSCTNCLTPVYIPGPVSISQGMASLRFISSGGQPCKNDTDMVLIRVSPSPRVNAGPDVTVCSDVNGIPISGQVSVAGGGVWTVAGGSGSFSGISSTTVGLNTTVNATYVPSSSDRPGYSGPNRSMQLILSSTNNISEGAQCAVVRDTLEVTIIPDAVVGVTPTAACIYAGGQVIQSQISHSTLPAGTVSGMWIGGDGSFSPSAFVSEGVQTVTYTPGMNDIAQGVVTLKLVSVGAGSCHPDTGRVTLVVSPPPLANAGSDMFVCEDSTARLEAEVISGVVSYRWYDMSNVQIGSGVVITTPTVISAPTDYVLEVVDNKGCRNRDTVRVHDVENPNVAISGLPHVCYDYYGVLRTTHTGVSPLGTFQWYYENVMISGANGDTVRIQQPGHYQVSYTLGSCTYSSGSTRVVDLPRVIAPDRIGCESSTVRAIANTVVPDNGFLSSYTYQWDDSYPIAGAISTGNPGILPTSMTSVDTMMYYVEVSSNTGVVTCRYVDSLRVISIPRPAPALVGDTMACQGGEILLDATRPPSNIPGLINFAPQYSWYEDSDMNRIMSTGSTLTVNESGAYVVKVSIDQCIGLDTSLVEIKPLAQSGLRDKYVQCIDQVGRVVLDAGRGDIGTNGLTGMTYLWSGPGAGPSSTNQTFEVLPEYFANGAEELAYTVTIGSVYGYLNCPVTDTVVVVDLCSPRVFPANAFHPGDGVLENSSFFVKTRYIKNFKITIFSRWGEIIYYSEDPKEAWDGKYRGEDMPMGVYAYIIEYEGKDETTKGPYRKEGKIVLIR